jgi:hypothetical protein
VGQPPLWIPRKNHHSNEHVLRTSDNDTTTAIYHAVLQEDKLDASTVLHRFLYELLNAAPRSLTLSATMRTDTTTELEIGSQENKPARLDWTGLNGSTSKTTFTMDRPPKRTDLEGLYIGNMSGKTIESGKCGQTTVSSICQAMLQSLHPANYIFKAEDKARLSFIHTDITTIRTIT